MRVGGLSSGIDVASMISQIMEAEGQRVEKVQESQDENNERIGAWIDIKDNLSGLTQATDTLRWMDVWRNMTAESSNTYTLTATAAANADTDSYSVTVTQLANAHTIASASGLTDTGGDPIASASTLLTDISGVNLGDQFSISGETFTIEADDTLSSLRNKINAATEDMPEDDQVSASILDNRLVLQRENTGETEITLSDTTGSPLNALGVLDGTGTPANELLAAQNALFTVQGAAVERSSNVGITDVLEGVTLNLYETGSSTLTIAKDTASIKSAIQTFIDEYNNSQEVIEGYAAIDRTDPSRPKPGLLYNDYLSRDLMYKVRGEAMQWMNSTHTDANASYSYNGTEGVMNSLQHIGVWTEGESNRLAMIDEDRLDAMLEQHPDLVENLFRGTPSQTQTGVREGGIAAELYSTTKGYTSTLDGAIDTRIERIDEEVLRQDDRIERLLDELEIKERMLWSQFGAMDEAIGSMQAGFDYLVSQLGSPSSAKG